jgi:acetyltransferase-like isoleucine patch superfamily enzyme
VLIKNQGESGYLCPIIGDDVWIGRNVVIMPGVIIGEGAVIGTGAVVTKNVDSFSVVGGVPASEICKRNSE